MFKIYRYSGIGVEVVGGVVDGIDVFFYMFVNKNGLDGFFWMLI